MCACNIYMHVGKMSGLGDMGRQTSQPESKERQGIAGILTLRQNTKNINLDKTEGATLTWF